MSYQTETEIERLVRAFEACEIGRDDFSHRDHVAVAVWYVHTLGREAALDRMRVGLMNFLSHHKVNPQRYSEAITVFWIDRVAQRLNELESETALVEKCNAIVESPDFIREIYVK